MTDIANYIKK
jgi:hypothetical protein